MLYNLTPDLREKLNRANEHIEQLEWEVEAFLNGTPNRTLIDYDAQSEQAFRDFHQHRPIPPRLPVLSGDALYQIRSTLDHAICALILQAGGTLTDKSQLPIFVWKPVKNDEIRRYEGQIKGITDPALLTYIEGLQPYNRPNERHRYWLTILKSLSNSDKHRALTLQTFYIEPRINLTTPLQDGMWLEIDRPDDGTPSPIEEPFPDGETIEIVKVQRRLSTAVTFAQWGDSGLMIDVASGLRTLLDGAARTTDILCEFLI
jgi:hypothetical protein